MPSLRVRPSRLQSDRRVPPPPLPWGGCHDRFVLRSAVRAGLGILTDNLLPAVASESAAPTTRDARMTP